MSTRYWNVLRIYSAIALAVSPGMVFSSNCVIPGSGFLICPTISAALRMPFSERTFLESVLAGLMIFFPPGWQTAQCLMNACSPSEPSAAWAGAARQIITTSSGSIRGTITILFTSYLSFTFQAIAVSRFSPFSRIFSSYQRSWFCWAQTAST